MPATIMVATSVALKRIGLFPAFENGHDITHFPKPLSEGRAVAEVAMLVSDRLARSKPSGIAPVRPHGASVGLPFDPKLDTSPFPACPFARPARREASGDRRERARLAADMKHVEAVIRLFDPAYDTRRIAVKRRNKANSLLRGARRGGARWRFCGSLRSL